MHRDADQIPNLFGSYVFNEEAMGQYVDEAAMNAWRACLRDGRPLTLDVAGAIADGMKVSAKLGLIAAFGARRGHRARCGRGAAAQQGHR